MGIKIGDVDVASQIIQNEYRIGVLELLLETLLKRMPTLGGRPIPQQEIQEIRRRVVAMLREKYPESGIELREGSDG